MSFKNLFDFTKQLEDNLKKLSEIPTMTTERKAVILEKLELLRNFNRRYNTLKDSCEMTSYQRNFN